MDTFCKECNNYIEESMEYHILCHRISYSTHYRDILLTEIYIDHIKIAEFHNDSISAF